MWEGDRRHVLKARGCGWCVSFGSRSLRLPKNPILGASMFLFLLLLICTPLFDRPSSKMSGRGDLHIHHG